MQSDTMPAMAMLTLDTHRAVQILNSSGFPGNQAEAIVRVLQEATLQNIATKDDIAMLKESISELKVDIFKWIVPLLLGQIAVFIALQKLL